MEFWLGFLCASVFIYIGTCIYKLIRADGTLEVDHSDPDKDVYRFVITDLESLNKKKRIVLFVDNNADLSQK